MCRRHSDSCSGVAPRDLPVSVKIMIIQRNQEVLRSFPGGLAALFVVIIPERDDTASSKG